jgi:hypothetical protein
MAKKSNDYAIWREAVVMMAANQKQAYGGHNKWSSDERQRFDDLFDRLKKQRAFNADESLASH